MKFGTKKECITLAAFTITFALVAMLPIPIAMQTAILVVGIAIHSIYDLHEKDKRSKK